MLVKLFAHKAAWFTAVNADGPTPKAPRFCYTVIRESIKNRPQLSYQEDTK